MALAAMKEDKTIAEIAQQNEVHPTQVKLFIINALGQVRQPRNSSFPVTLIQSWLCVLKRARNRSESPSHINFCCLR